MFHTFKKANCTGFWLLVQHVKNYTSSLSPTPPTKSWANSEVNCAFLLEKWDHHRLLPTAWETQHRQRSTLPRTNSSGYKLRVDVPGQEHLSVTDRSPEAHSTQIRVKNSKVPSDGQRDFFIGFSPGSCHECWKKNYPLLFLHGNGEKNHLEIYPIILLFIIKPVYRFPMYQQWMHGFWKSKI